MRVVKTQHARPATVLLAAVAVATLSGYLAGDVGAQTTARTSPGEWTPDADCPPLPRNLRARQVALTESSTLAIVLAAARRQEATVAEIEQAISACREGGALSLPRAYNHNDRFNTPAYMCVADLSYDLAQGRSTNREANYRQAFCSARTAADLMQLGRAPADKVAAAHQRRADAAWAWRSLSAGQTQQSLALLQAARRGYEDAARLQPTADRYFQLSIVLTELGLAADARRAIEDGIRLSAAGAEGARSLVRFAEYRQSQNAPSSEVLDLLQRAQAAAPNSVSVNAAIGQVHMSRGDSVSAESAFERANRQPPDANDSIPGSVNYLAVARLGLAQIRATRAREPGQWQDVQQLATSALQVGGGGPEYNRVLCLAYVGIGGDAVRDGANGAWCETGAGPDAQLLRGVYLLRRAQYYTSFGVRNVSNTEVTWRGYVRQAERLFEEGRLQIAADRTPLTDPRAQAARDELNRRLAYGADLADWVGEFCRTSGPGIESPEGTFFNNLHVVQCRP